MKSKGNVRLYALYVRVSTHKQDAKYQVRVLKEYLKKHDPSASYELFEDVATGSNTNRPAFVKMMAERHRFTDLAVVKMDRLGRSLKQLLETLEMLSQSKVNFIAVEQHIDLSTPQGRMMAQLLGSFAEFEKSMCVDRVCAGLAEARAKGKKLGRKSIEVNKQQVLKMLQTKSIRLVAQEMGLKKSTVGRIAQEA